MSGEYRIYHTGSSNNYRSIVEGGLIAGGTSDRRGRQACEHHTSHVTFSHCVAQVRVFVVRTSHSMCHPPHVFVLTLFDYTTSLSLLSIFSLIILSFLLPINFIFHDVVDKFPVHSS